MRNFYILLKSQFINVFNVSRKNKKSVDKEKRAPLRIAIIVLITALLSGVCFFYALLFGEGLVLSKELYMLTPFMIGFSSILNLFLSFYSVGSVLFSNKDYDLLSSMPIKKSSIIFAKLAFMYVTSLLITLIATLPSYFAILYLGESLSFKYVTLTFLSAFFAPLLVIAVATLLATAIHLALAGLKRKTLWQNLLMPALFIAFFGLGFIGEGQSAVTLISKLYFVTPILVKGTAEVGYFFLYLAINVLSFAVTTFIVCVFYHRINTLMRRSYKNKNFKLQKQIKSSKKKALVKRELKTLFSIPIYLLNVITGPVISLVGSIVFTVMVFNMGGDEGLKQLAMAIVPAVLLFTHMLAPSTASCISLEGKSFWVIKSAPIKESHFLACKLGSNFLVNTLPAVVSSLILSIFVAPSIRFVLIIFVFAVGGSVLSGNLGLLFNLKFPKMNWENEAQVAKNGLPVLLSMVVAFVLVGISVAITVLCKTAFAIELAMLIEALFILVSTVITFYFIMAKGPEMLRKI